MYRSKLTLLLALLITTAVPSFAQRQPQQEPSRQELAQSQLDTLMQAQQALSAADQAGAQVHAKSLYDDAQWRFRFAQDNWNQTKSQLREQARMRAEQALWAGRAALAKSRWLGTNAAIRSLQDDITRLGGTSNVSLTDESPTIELARGQTSKDRIEFAQRVLDQAGAAGGEQIAGNDLATARGNLNTARKIVRGDPNSETADHLSYTAEMMARRAYYMAQANVSNRGVTPLQLERTRLAEAASSRRAAEEAMQREAAQRQAAELQRQLAAEQANRQAAAEELAQLRAQVEENQRMVAQRIEADRSARVDAERRLDELMRQYENAVVTAPAGDIEALRRQVEDQQISLRAIQERERLNEQTMSAEIAGLRTDLDQARAQGNAQLLAEREAVLQRRQQELEQMRREREADMARRAELERTQQAAIAEAQRRRQEAEAQAQQLRMQVEQAQQQAQAAAQQAQAAAQQAQQTQEAARQREAELQRMQQQTQTELEASRAESRRLRMQQELSRLAPTRTDPRGLIMTLPGIFFDTGKSALKPGAKSTLTKVAEQLKGEASVRISVEGHTDSVGSEASNQKLSESRAQAVRDFLVGAGFSADRISSAGRGESTPVASNNNAAGRQQNRRVELVITQ